MSNSKSVKAETQGTYFEQRYNDPYNGSHRIASLFAFFVSLDFICFGCGIGGLERDVE